jgi:Xaa-Pro aminopeptidase
MRDSVAWLLNIRGADVDRRSPFPVIAHADGTADWFIAPKRSRPRWRPSGQCRAHRRADGFTGALAALAGKTVAVDPERAVAAIFATLANGARLSRRDPCVLPKAVKNPSNRPATARPRPATARRSRASSTG